MGLIRNIARRWKVRTHFTDSSRISIDAVLQAVLNKTKYLKATGSIVDTALSHILDDIAALPDITEVESHRLSELCRILNALEGLFVVNTEEVLHYCSSQCLLGHSLFASHTQPSLVVAYVPSWLKFSYLSELLVSFCFHAVSSSQVADALNNFTGGVPRRCQLSVRAGCPD